MALAWKAGWVQALRGSNPLSSAMRWVELEQWHREVAAAGLRCRLGNAAGAFTSNAKNTDLRRAQLSFLPAWAAEWAFTVWLGIVAYRAGRRRDSRWARRTRTDGPVCDPGPLVVDVGHEPIPIAWAPARAR